MSTQKLVAWMFIAAIFTVPKRRNSSNAHQLMNGEIKYDVSINGILFGSKEWSADRCYNMDEPWKHFAKWKKSVTKDLILYDSIYIRYPE